MSNDFNALINHEIDNSCICGREFKLSQKEYKELYAKGYLRNRIGIPHEHRYYYCDIDIKLQIPEYDISRIEEYYEPCS